MTTRAESVECGVARLQSGVDYISMKLADLRLDIEALRKQIDRLDDRLQKWFDNLLDRQFAG